MEELRKMEQIQKLLNFMHSREVASSSSPGSDRFLADLILLLIQPCGELDIGSKLSLIFEYIPKISVRLLEEASQWLGSDAFSNTVEKYDYGASESKLQDFYEDLFSISIIKNKEKDIADSITRMRTSECCPLEVECEDAAVVRLESMEKANSTIGDFCRSYFMFHGMEVSSPEALFRYLPVLSFTESYIYQLDNLNEEYVHSHAPMDGELKRGSKEEVELEWTGKLRNALGKDPFKPLLCALECRGLLKERIKEELVLGEEYWALERKLCHALMTQKEIAVGDVLRAIHLKSFDYRVLNLLLYLLRGQVVNDLHMEFLSVSELLVEIADDLFDYEEDVLENGFNILRMFVKIYGPSKAPAMLAKYITEAEERYNSLLRRLDPELSSRYQRRCEEATREGGCTTGHPAGTWNIPSVIEDEDLYRSSCLSTG